MLKRWWESWKTYSDSLKRVSATILVGGGPPLVWLMGERESMVGITGKVLRQLNKVHGRGLVLISDPDGWEHLGSWYGECDIHRLKDPSDMRKGAQRIIEEKGVYVAEMSPNEDDCEGVVEMCQELARVVDNIPRAYRDPLPYIVMYGLPPTGISSLGEVCTDLRIPVVCLTEQHYFWRQHEGSAHESMGKHFSCHLRAESVDDIVPLESSGVGIRIIMPA